MASPKKFKKQQAAEFGVAVLESPPEASPVPAPIDVAATTALLRGEAARAATTIWQRNQRITAVWGKAEARNSWVAIRGVGWKKLANTCDSANHALTVLASQAFLSNRPVDYREGEDGMIHEIYVW